MARKDYRKARRHTEVSVGESVRTMRELQELSQNEHRYFAVHDLGNETAAYETTRPHAGASERR